MAKHVVKHIYCVDDEIRTVAHQFDSYDEAFLHAESSNAQTVQLFSPSGELLKERQATAVVAEDTSTPTES
jgi:hypothetical protein